MKCHAQEAALRVGIGDGYHFSSHIQKWLRKDHATFEDVDFPGLIADKSPSTAVRRRDKIGRCVDLFQHDRMQFESRKCREDWGQGQQTRSEDEVWNRHSALHAPQFRGIRGERKELVLKKLSHGRMTNFWVAWSEVIEVLKRA